MKNLGFGLMRLPLKSDGSGSIDIERTKALADSFIENGFTYFDTAACYHKKESEGAFCEAVAKRYPREAYSITDKLSLFMLKSKDEIPGFFDNQLKTLGVDYLDIYLIHSLDKNSYATAKEWGAFEFVSEKLKEGKVRHIGFSFHGDAETLDIMLNEQPEVEYVQLQINYIDWEDEVIQSRKCYEVARKHGKKILIMEPVKGGSLANVSDMARAEFDKIDPNMSTASFAIRFAASLPGVVMVLSGMSNEAQLADNMSYMKDFVPFTEGEIETVINIADAIKNEIAIGCTGCRYCVDFCAQNIMIPDYFNYYNIYHRFKSLPWRDKNALNDIMKNNGKPSDCIECGACETHCPQSLDIRELLKITKAAFEK